MCSLGSGCSYFTGGKTLLEINRYACCEREQVHIVSCFVGFKKFRKAVVREQGYMVAIAYTDNRRVFEICQVIIIPAVRFELIPADLIFLLLPLPDLVGNFYAPGDMERPVRVL